MGEEWRRKTFYRTRVLIETERILNPQFSDSLVCLTGAEIELLRNTVKYLHRRSTFVSEYEAGGYLAPTNAEWDALQAIVANLEETLMGCSIDELVVAINAQTDVLDLVRQCVCANTTWAGRDAGRLPDVAGYVANNDVTYESVAESSGTFTDPPTDVIRCEYAQAVWLWHYQTYTEVLLPWANSTADTLTAIIVASTAFSALVAWIGVPIAILSSLLLAVVAWGVDGSIANFTNWLWAAKDEIVCLLYNTLPDTGAAALALKDYVNAAAELSFLDKQVLLAMLASEWHMSWIIKDQEENDTWRSYLVAGQCDNCVPVPPGFFSFLPCNLDDWHNGLVECGTIGPVHKGGMSYTDKESGLVPSDGILVIHFIPRSETHPTAKTDFGLRKVGDLVHVNVISGVDQPVDVPITVYANITSALWGNDCYVDAYQQTWWAEVLWWGVTDSWPP